MFKKSTTCSGSDPRLNPVRAVKKPAAAEQPRFVFEKLEPRLLLSADAIGAALSADLLDDDSAQTFDNPQQLDAWLTELTDSTPLPLKPAAETAALDLSAFAEEDGVAASIRFDPADQWQEQLSSLLDEDSPQRVELVFVDSSVDNYQQLLAGLQTDAGVDYQVTIIDRDADGIAQIGQVLQGQSGIDAIHLVTHGADGVIQLGDTVLNSESLGQYTQQMSNWQSALSADADLLIYGCDVAASEVGDQFLQQLSSLLAVDIAASDDLTGNKQLGADWSLEYQQGVVESGLAFSAQVQQQWQGSLATVVVTTTSWSSLLSNTSSIDALNANKGLDGEISLLEALRAVNNTPNVDGPDQILFDLPAFSTITPLSTIPAITDAVIIDGLTGSGQTSPFIEINGTFLRNSDGFELQASDSTIHGLSIHSFDYDGIWVVGDNNTITGNYIGTGRLGVEDLGNGFAGIRVNGSNNTIGGDLTSHANVIGNNANNGIVVSGEYNVISGNYIGTGLLGVELLGNDFNGIRVEGSNNTIGGDLTSQSNVIGNNSGNGILVVNTSDATIQGNKIGVNAAGNAAIANAGYGIQIYASSNTAIGGVAANEGNLISGNALAGIVISEEGSFDNRIEGNYIGTNAIGNAAIGNGREGIWIADGAVSTAIGGSSAEAGNLISGNGLDGVHLNGAKTVGNVVVGNLIGSSVDGYSAVGNGRDGIRIFDSSNNQIGGVNRADRNIISGNAASGIAIYSNKATSNTVEGNYIGTDLNAFGALANGADGILIASGASNNIIGGSSAGSGNVISGNLAAGVHITNSSSTGNSIVGNFIGTNANAFGALGNGSHGVFIESAKNNTVGGALAAERNIISGNGGDGIAISGSSSGNVVKGNFIGTDFNGTALLSNAGSGVRLDAENNTVGGSTSGEGNIISGNMLDGVVITEDDNRVRGNFIGTDVNGTGILANGLSGSGVGVRIEGGATGNIIGGQSLAMDGNLISANTDQGILIDGVGTSGNSVLGNKVGTDISGVLSLANGASGVLIQNGATNNAIGGLSSLSANTIAFNGQSGVRVTENISTGNTIRSNSIHSNSGLGIDLGGGGVSANDVNDGDLGANGLQNFPQLSTALVNGVNISIAGSINTAAATSVELDFFSSDTADDSANGEGKVFLGTLTVVTDASGNNSFSSNFAASVTVGQYISATATTVDGTSEFSLNIIATTALNSAPTGGVTISGTVEEDQQLTANNNIGDVDGFATVISYQWQRDGVDIAGAMAETYTLADADVAARITVVASYEDNLGKTETVSSSPTSEVVNINDPLTGTVTISGTAEDNATLTASETLADDDGISGLISFQWRADGVDIVGATGENYLLSDAEVGKAISVVASYTDDNNTEESLESSATALVVEVNDPVTGTVSITGTAADNQLLTASNNFEDEDGISNDGISYQWFNDDGAIDGATMENYSVTDSDVGQQIFVQATVLDDAGNIEVINSTATAVVTDVNDPVEGTVTISGVAEEDQLLTANQDLSDEDGLGEISWQWQRDGVDITGATDPTYQLGDADVGSAITVAATYTDQGNTIERVVSAETVAVANINDSPQGSVTISGLIEEDQLLTASHNLSDQDGLGQISWQWQRDGVAITGATDSTYQLGDDDVGSVITVAASYTDQGNTLERVVSAETAAVANINDSPQGRVTISGLVEEDQLLTASEDLSDADGLGEISWQWQRDGVDIAGATDSTYQLGDADVGSEISVAATYTDQGNTVERVVSADTVAVANVNDSPQGSVTISGLIEEDQLLTVSHNLSDQDGLGEISWQWQRDGVDILGATEPTYQLGDDDVGSTISVAATYTDQGNTIERVVSAETLAVANINDSPQGTVTISGLAEEDQLLTASENLSDLDGLGEISWQWQRDGVDITGATGTSYQLGDDDVGSAITVAASYTDQGNTSERVLSAGTAAVANVNDSPQGNVTISGLAEEDQLLTASHNLSDEDGLGEIRWQWQRDGVDITGATATSYQLGDNDVGSTISVAATYTDQGNTAERVVSAETVAAANVNDSPQGSVTVSGKAEVDQFLSASHNLSDADGLGTISYQWQRGGVDIAGATTNSYQVTEADQVNEISVKVSYTDGNNTAEVVSSAGVLVASQLAGEIIDASQTDTKPSTDASNPAATEPADTPAAAGGGEQATEDASTEEADADQPLVLEADLDLLTNNRTIINNLDANSLANSGLNGSGIERPKGIENASSINRSASADNSAEQQNTDTLDSGFASESISFSGLNSAFSSFNDPMSLVGSSNLKNSLDEVQQQMQNNLQLSQQIIGGSVAVSGGISVGYVVWLVRSGAILSSVMSALPAWRFIDPLPILSASSGGADGDEETLQSMVGDNSDGKPEHDEENGDK
jgi:hypothetical protein